MHCKPIACALLFFGLVQAAAGQTWMSMTIDGRKVGSMHIERAHVGDRVVTRQIIDLRLTRGKTSTLVHNDIEAEETAAGKPLAFHARTRSSTDDETVDGTIRDDGRFQVATTVGGQSTVRLLEWPGGASLSEGQRVAIVQHGFAPGTLYSLRVFDPVKQQVATLDTRVMGVEHVDLPHGVETLHHLRQNLENHDDQIIDLWVDDSGLIRRSVTPAFGARMELLACDQACASAPDQDVDMLRATMVPSPRGIPYNARLGTIRYVVSVASGTPNPFIDTDEQRVVTVGDGRYELTIALAQAQPGESGPTPDDLVANPWVQSDAPDIVALAKQVTASARNDLGRMRSLRSFVTGYIQSSDLDVGYASALETLRTRRGDCTEHAVLLAALARASGVPTRIVTGLVYTERYAGASHVFVPHTWVQAWLGDRWTSFDSAEVRFDTTHIALGVGSGDPWRFFSAMSALGNIAIHRVATPLGLMMNRPPAPGEREPMPSPTAAPSPPPPPSPSPRR